MHGINKAARRIGGDRKAVKMNILYITNHLNIGGITSYVFSLARGLRQRGHNVYVASSGGQLAAKFKQENIFFLPMPIKTKSEISPKIFVSLLKLLGAVKQYNIEIVHANSRTTQVLGYLLARLTGLPYISTCHGFFKKRLSRRIFGCWGERVIAISEPVKEHLVRDFKVEEERIRVIHHGIDVNKFSAESTEHRVQKKKDLGLGIGPVIGIVARLSDVKGHIYLIEAMKTVLANITDAQLLIVGEGKMKEELVDLSKRLGIEKHIYFLPSFAETKDVLAAMDIFVLPSLKEGLGLSLMEAMAQGLAVIGTNVGGIKTLIQDGINGLLVTPADINGLSGATISLLENSAKRQDLGNNARAFIKDNFSQEKMVLETEKLYQECLSARY
jgi:glycosyltransferase involved in cell wall biosynthesis